MKLGLIKKQELPTEVPLLDVKFTHSLCVGQTGCGKTTSFIYPNLKKRMSLEHGILFFDIKGSEHLSVKSLAKQTDRLNDVIEIGKPWGKNINILKEMNEREFSSLLKGVLNAGKDAGNNAYFYSAAEALGMLLYTSLRTCEMLIQEFHEVNEEITFLEKKCFGLEDIYKIIISVKSLEDFIKKLNDFKNETNERITKLISLDYSKNMNIYKNLILNLKNLEKCLNGLTPYKKVENTDLEKTYTYVLDTLRDPFGFMLTSSSKYISSTSDVLSIVEALQDKKIIIINVRVIPDVILEILLEQVFEELIDLNIQDEEERVPTSIFIDEAQRLINKDIPLDVLRSSKVDVVMAVQSELQLISKFGTKEHWQQISINIAQKYAFRSSLFSSESNSFFPDTGAFETFEYTKEYDNRIYKAIPIFINKEESIKTEYEYQHDILKIDDLKKDEYFIYDVSHFEREREVVVQNIKTKKRHHQKIFNELESLIIEQYLSNLPDVIKENFLNSLANTYENKILDYFITLESYMRLYDEWDIQNSHMYKEAKLGEFQQETDGLEYIKTHKLLSGEYWFDSIDVVKHTVYHEDSCSEEGLEFDTYDEAHEYGDSLYNAHERDYCQGKKAKKVFILLKKLSDERKMQLGFKNYTLKEQLSIIEQKPIYNTYVKEIPNCVKRKFMEVLYDYIDKDLNQRMEFDDFKQLYLKFGSIQNIKIHLKSKVRDVRDDYELSDFMKKIKLDNEKKEERGDGEYSIEEMIEIIEKYPIEKKFKYRAW